MAPSRQEFEAMISLPQVRAALDTIAWAEGGISYQTLYGGGTFAGNQHPNRKITAGGYTSTAAGRYQFLYSTWSGIKQKLGLSDFGPRNQDIGAVYLIWERGQLSNLLAGDFETVCKNLGCLWAALPYATCGQNRRSASSTMQYFNGALAALGGSSKVPNTLAAASGGSNDDLWLVAGVVVLALLLA